MLNIAHRGAGAYAPHNSRQAFFQAIALKADMIETDIRVTKDNIPIIFHDAEIFREPIASLTWEEIKNYPLANGEQILKLDEFLQIFSTRIALNLEIKPIDLEHLEPVLAIINKYNPEKPLISSFSFSIVKEVGEKTAYDTALLIDKKHGLENIFNDLTVSKAKGINLYYHLLEANLVKALQEKNYQVIVWTDFISEIWNPLPLYNKAYRLGCDGFITGKPDLLFCYLKSIGY